MEKINNEINKKIIKILKDYNDGRIDFIKTLSEYTLNKNIFENFSKIDTTEEDIDNFNYYSDELEKIKRDSNKLIININKNRYIPILDNKILYKLIFDKNKLIIEDKINKKATEINYNTELITYIISDIIHNNNSIFLKKNNTFLSIANIVLKQTENIKEILFEIFKYPDNNFKQIGNESADTLIHLIQVMCEAGNIDGLKYLFLLYTDNFFNFTSLSNILESAYIGGNIEVIRFLESMIIKTKDFKYGNNMLNSMLKGTCASGKLEIVEYLLDNNPEITNINDKIFKYIDNPRIADFLITKYLTIDDLYKSRKAIFYYAVKNDHFDVVQLLLAKISDKQKIFKLINSNFKDGKTILDYAAKNNNIAMLKLLFNQVPIKNRLGIIFKKSKKKIKEGGFIPLIHETYDFFENFKEYNFEIIEFLINQMPDEKKKIELMSSKYPIMFNYHNNKFDISMLDYAISKNDLKTLKFLLEQISNKKDLVELIIGNRLVERAIRSCDLKIVQFLFNQIADKEKFLKIVMYKDIDNCPILFYSSENNDPRLIKFLFNLISKEEITKLATIGDKFGKTILYYAAMNNKFENFKFIFNLIPEKERVQQISEINICNETMLHQAIRNNNLEMFKFLLKQLPEEKIVNLITSKNKFNETIFNYIATSITTNSSRDYNEENGIDIPNKFCFFKILFNYITDKEKRIEIITSKIGRNKNESIFHDTLRFGEFKIFKFLFEQFDNKKGILKLINTINSMGNDLFQNAIRHENPKFINFLLDQLDNEEIETIDQIINSKNNYNNKTLLHYAIERNDKNIIEKFFNKELKIINKKEEKILEQQNLLKEIKKKYGMNIGIEINRMIEDFEEVLSSRRNIKNSL